MLQDKKLAVFFTFGVSLNEWQRVGNLNRELKPYIKMAESFNHIYLITYGRNDEKDVVDYLPSNITILANENNLPNFLYSLLIPFIFHRKLSGCFFIKTCQMNGSWSAVLTKLVLRKKLIIRCGYEWYYFAIRDNKKLWKRIIIKYIERIAYTFADSIIITSESAKSFVIKNYGINPNKIHIIPNYIDTDLFKPKDTEVENSVVFVGRFSNQKNIFSLIDAVSNISLLKLSLVGSGELNSEVKNYAEQHLMKRVELLGNILNEQLPQILNKSHIFILPSLYEGNPKTLLEAMSCGKVCVGTNVEGINNVIDDKINGYLCDTTSQSIQNAITSLLKDKETQKRLRTNARQKILNHFSLKYCLKRELNLYSEQ